MTSVKLAAKVHGDMSRKNKWNKRKERANDVIASRENRDDTRRNSAHCKSMLSKGKSIYPFKGYSRDNC